MPRLDESLLTHLPPFDGLSRTDIRRILDGAVSRRFEIGADIFREGEPADRFFLLLDGYIRVVRTTESGELITVLHIPAGQLFGIARAIGRETYPGRAVAAAECIVLCWPTALWDDFTRQYPGFTLSMARTVGVRLGEIQSRMQELATLHVEARIATALLRLITQTGRQTEAGVEIDFPLTRQDLSEMTGTTLHTVSRLLSAWQREGVVQSQHRRITVLDRARLEACAQHRG